jgi:hypothetical protein
VLATSAPEAVNGLRRLGPPQAALDTSGLWLTVTSTSGEMSVPILLQYQAL